MATSPRPSRLKGKPVASPREVGKRGKSRRMGPEMTLEVATANRTGLG